MKDLLMIVQIVVSILLIVVVMLQSSGTGLGSAWGGSGSYHTKRGFEKVLFRFTIILSVVFIFLSLMSLV